MFGKRTIDKFVIRLLDTVTERRITSLNQIGNFTKIFDGYKEFVVQIYKLSYFYEKTRLYYSKRTENDREYNIFLKSIEVALGNFYLLSLWKLFDKGSEFSIHKITDRIKNDYLIKFVHSEISDASLLCEIIDNLNEWRCGIIAHRDLDTYFNGGRLETYFPLERGDLEKLKKFTLTFLCHLEHVLYRKPMIEIEHKYNEELSSKERLYKADMDLILTI